MRLFRDAPRKEKERRPDTSRLMDATMTDVALCGQLSGMVLAGGGTWVGRYAPDLQGMVFQVLRDINGWRMAGDEQSAQSVEQALNLLVEAMRAAGFQPILDPTRAPSAVGLLGE